MSLADLAIKRPVFITAIVVVLLAVGLLAMKKMSVDLFPNVTFPIVMVQTIYPGAGPEEVETLVSRVLEDEISTVAGIKNLSSTNYEGVSTVVVEFTLETDIKDAEQQIRAKVSGAKRSLPTDIEEPIIRRIDPADQPIVILALTADLPPAELFDLADKSLRPRIEQVSQVGLVQVVGGREREIHVELDRKKLKQYEISATGVAQRISAAGQNVPAGKVDSAKTELTFRTVGQFPQVADVGNVIVSFLGNDVPVTVNQVATVNDTVEDEATRAFVNGERSIFALVYRQTGANTINVADAVKARVEVVNKEFAAKGIKAKVKAVRDGAQPIRANVYDVEESILIGIILTILVVYFFLGSGRSTFITGLALPNSLIGAFFLMSLAGFTINLMTLLALSLAVGLLIDDAIVVRENIFRHAEMGKNAMQAASDGTKEVLLAVVATTGAIIAVFGPVGFLSGVVGQFFKEFALTICFAMVISLFDAVTMAPMLSAYFAGHHGHKEATNPIGKFWQATMGRLLKGFDRFQTKLENGYASILRWMTKGNLRPAIVIAAAMGIFVISLMSLGKIPKTFLPPADNGEFSVSLEAPPGTNVEAMAEIATKIDGVIRGNKEIEQSVMFVGSGQTGEANKASFFVKMIPFEQRKNLSTTMMKDHIREQLKPFAQYIPIVKDIDNVGGGGARAFTMNIMGSDLKQLEEYSAKVFAKLKTHPAFLDVDVGYRPGKPEFQVQPDKRRSELLGVATNTMGAELRTQVEGTVAAVFREKGEEYDIRVRMKPDQRNLADAFNESYVPNVNGTLVRLRDVAKPVETTGPATITRQNRSRYISIGADIDPKGPGMSAAMADIDKMFAAGGELALPQGVSYRYVGQAESFQELIESIVIAMGMGVLFIYLVLASLYESFITPFTILLVLPLAACGAFFALLFTGESLNIYSMIGCVLLLGVATKNSILLVDYTNQLLHEGKTMAEAVVEAGRVRLRPILMTTLALIAGMLPIAIGLNEASKQRTSMGVAVIGGLVSSTLLTLLVVPAAFEYMEGFRRWSLALVKRIVGANDEEVHQPVGGTSTPADAHGLKH